MNHVTVRRVALAASALLVAACQDAPVPTAPNPGAPLAAMSPTAQDRIEAIFQRTSPEVMALPGTVFSDNDERIGKLVIGIDNMGAARAVENALERLGVDEADYAIELTQPVRFMATLRDTFRPVPNGVQINFGNYVCSIGYNATHVASGERSMITASHCTNRQGGVEGTLYYQPSQSSQPTAISLEVADPDYLKGIPGCPRGKKCRYSDAARSRYYETAASSRGVIPKTTGVNNGSITLGTGEFSVTSQDNNASVGVGATVHKVGRTTGWTSGVVDRTCVNTSVTGSTVYLFCQVFVKASGSAIIVSGGDSGSGAFRITSGDNVEIVGTLWGGSSDNKTFVYSPLKQVQQELGSLNTLR